ncbi:MAG: NUDIX hydrolase, partial [Rhodospirillales bacterium]|nr:NUDIX hydrolase [Rhodospirillales bacterium]
MTAFKIVPQSAVIPYRYEGGELRILLITSLGTKRWVLPKGHIERGLTPRESAEFEAFEEAGLSGDVEELSIGAYTYMKNKKKGGRQCRVEVFPMNFKHMVDDYPEAGLRKRKWM